MVNAIMNKLTVSCFIFFLINLFCAKAIATVDPWAESYRLEALTQYDAASKALDPIISKYARNEFAVLRQGWLNYLQGNHNQSIKDYQKAIEINPDSLDAKLGITLPLLAQQRWNEVASTIDQILKIAPWNYYAHLRLMIAEEGMKQWATLEKHARNVFSRYPSDATILVYLARAQRWLNKNTEAREAYKLVLERVPGHIEALQFLEGTMQ